MEPERASSRTGDSVKATSRGRAILSAMGRMTRRQALLAGVGAATAALMHGEPIAWAGTSDERIARVLGVEEPLAGELIANARAWLGADYESHAAAFLKATTSPAKFRMSRAKRRAAVEAFVDRAFFPNATLAYAGLRESGRPPRCRWLRRG